MGKSRHPKAKTHDHHIWLLGTYNHVAVKTCSRKALAYASEKNRVSFSYSRDWSFRTYVEMIARHASTPIPINSLSAELDKHTLSRGGVLLGPAAKYIDSIISRSGLQWWIDDEGLTIDYPVPEAEPTDFKWVAGKLMAERFVDGRLPEAALLDITKALDEREFPLLPNLQGAQRKVVGAYNQRRSLQPIRTFQQAVGNPVSGARLAVQRTLYAARTRFLGLNKNA